jgi:putative oxidoreductase
VIRKVLSTAPFSLDLALLVLRLTAGIMLATHGWGKLTAIEKFVPYVEQLGLPAPTAFAWAAAISEFFGGIFVAAGLLTRFGAIFAGIVMAVAAFQFHAQDPFEKKELAILYLSVFAAVFFAGPGRVSLDHLMAGGGSRGGKASKA